MSLKSIPGISAFVPRISAFVPVISAFVFGVKNGKKSENPVLEDQTAKIRRISWKFLESLGQPKKI
jgi:hypothetical protein